MKSAKTKIALAIWLTFWITVVLFTESWPGAVAVAGWMVVNSGLGWIAGKGE